MAENGLVYELEQVCWKISSNSFIYKGKWLPNFEGAALRPHHSYGAHISYEVTRYMYQAIRKKSECEMNFL